MIRVLINATSVRGGGAETFLLGLLPELTKSRDMVIDIILCADKAELYQRMNNLNIITVSNSIYSNALKRFYYEHVSSNRILLTGEYHVYFRADEMMSPVSLLARVPTMVVFHTTSHKLIPDDVGDSKMRLSYINLMKWLAMRIVTVPVAVSHHEHGELSGIYPFARSKTHVIYHGINQKSFCPASENKSAPFKHIGIKRYLLSVSDRHKHKNFLRLVKAYKLTRERSTCDADLVIIGRVKSSKEESLLISEIVNSEYRDNIHLFDYMGHDTLPMVFQGAVGYIFPSTFETFGFTPLEAMACGIPVACSNYSCMPEVCGDAAIYFDPFDIDDISNAMVVIVSNKNRRDELIASGLKHVARYTWQHAAAQYEKIIKRVVLTERGRHVSHSD